MSSVLRVSPLSGVDAAFDDLVRRTFSEVQAAAWAPPADIVISGEDAILTLEVPGVDPASVEVEVKERTLLVRGERKALPESSQVIRSEIRRGAFSRDFRLPSALPADSVHASYADGLLHIRISGARPAPVSQRIPVEGLATATDAPALEQ